MTKNKLNIFPLIGNINDEMLKLVIRSTYTIKQCKNIALSTAGGEVYAANGIYDWLRNEAPDCRIIATGYVMSAGVQVLQAAEMRVALPNTQFLIHYGHEECSSRTERKHNEAMIDMYIDTLVKHSNLTRKQLLKFMDQETYFDSTTALDYGLIDCILGVDDE